MRFDYDFVVVGSGFGGSVAGLRLVEKGYRVLMLEQGRELHAQDLPKTNWDLARWMWMPLLGFRGFFKMTILRHATIMSGVGVGGGSTTYAATLPLPPDSFFQAGNWAGLADWQEELRPHYATARRMLGVASNPRLGEADRALAQVAERRGEMKLFQPTEVGIYFGKAGKTVPDPYFGGRGPERTGCIHCGGCMLGCPHGAKNTLDKNYLHLARARGLELQAETRVVAVRALSGGGYRVEGRRGIGLGGQERLMVTTQNVVLAAGVLGTVELLLRMKGDPEGLPQLSECLGRYARTNSESFIGVISSRPEADLSKGLAIGSIYHCAPNESVEPVRYSDGSGFFRILMAPHVEGDSMLERLSRLVAICFRHPLQIWKAFTAPHMARRMSILMYMRTIEGTLRLVLSKWGGLTTRRESGPTPVASFAAASELAREASQVLHGFPFSLVHETLFNIPTTAHILGGAVMGKDASTGVIDTDQRAFGYEGLYVVDGAAMSANPGVNPSLSILAMAERAMSKIPGKAATRRGHAPSAEGPLSARGPAERERC